MFDFQTAERMIDVHSDIRGPIFVEANKMSAAGIPVLKLNTGNPATFGFQMPDSVRNALLQNVETATVFAKCEVKVWECRNCGHIIVGTEAPEVCPTCDHPKAYFEIHAENY